tara:strand:- start:822 stop:1145 length:324 start_codon:yes stop_codon:yes gene_type:complete
MKYTKSDLQLSDKSLFDAIIQVGKSTEKTNPALGARLLSNFNTYNVLQMEQMLVNFQRLLVNSVVESGKETLDVEYVIENKMNILKQIIHGENPMLLKPELKRSPNL